MEQIDDGLPKQLSHVERTSTDFQVSKQSISLDELENLFQREQNRLARELGSEVTNTDNTFNETIDLKQAHIGMTHKRQVSRNEAYQNEEP